jgi:DNA-binding protein H-NS
MTTQSDDSEQDLALLNEDNARIRRVVINETHEKFLLKDWLIEGGRAANSVLAMQVLGTKEGLQGSTALTVDQELVPVFDMLLLWILMGDQYLESTTNLTEENASALNALAQYFGLEQLEQAIEMEQKKREQKHQQDQQQQAEESTINAWFEIIDVWLRGLHVVDLHPISVRSSSSTARSKNKNGRVKCVRCRNWTTQAPTYRGNTPRCRDCRRKQGR